MHEWNKTSSRAEKFHWSFHGRMKLKKIRMWVAPERITCCLKQEIKVKSFPNEQKTFRKNLHNFSEHFFFSSTSFLLKLSVYFVQMMIPLFVHSSKLFDLHFFEERKFNVENLLWANIHCLSTSFELQKQLMSWTFLFIFFTTLFSVE